MEYKQALYLKLLMEVGITDDFDNMLDEMLENENPLSNLTLALLDCNGNRNEQIHVLNEYINNVPLEQINTDAVFYMLVDKFKLIYEENPKLIGKIAQWMSTIAVSSNLCYQQPWYTMYQMEDYCYLSNTGVYNKDTFKNDFLQFLYQKKLIN